ncbi:hypothetical protein ACTXT7_000002 [Hymenolepis weldensis]
MAVPLEICTNWRGIRLELLNHNAWAGKEMRAFSYAAATAAAAKMFAMNYTRPQQTSQPPLSSLIYNPPNSYNIPSRSTISQSKESSSPTNSTLPTPLDLLPVLSPVSAWRAALPGERSYFSSVAPPQTHPSSALHFQSSANSTSAVNNYHHNQQQNWGERSYHAANFTPSTTAPILTPPSPSYYSGHNGPSAQAGHTPNNSPSKSTDSSANPISSNNKAFFSQPPGNTGTTDVSSQPITACP